MSHTDALEQALLNKCVQSPQKPSHGIVKMWELLVPICHVTVVMEEGYQKSERLSYTTKFKHEVVQCAEGKGNRKATVIFGLDEGNVRL
jgi:hypothetical protein